VSPALRCNRCGRVGGRLRRRHDARLRLCDECLPGFEAALVTWRARTAGAHDDSTVERAWRPGAGGDLAGFGVECADGRIGVVEGLKRSRATSDVSVVIRTGLFVSQRRLVPLEDVVTVLPEERRLVVRTPSL
jgi:hypothetical protein